MRGTMRARPELGPAGPTVYAAAEVERVLEAEAPELVCGFAANLTRAADVVARRLIGAAQREGIGGGERELSWEGDRAFFPLADGGYLVARARRHGFDRVEVAQRLNVDPAALLLRIAGHTDEARALAIELTDACLNLAIAYARTPSPSAQSAGRASARDSLDLVASMDADEACLILERLATEGHNLHPCGRTRLGWSVPDVLRYDLESPGVDVGLVGVRRDLHVGDDLGELFTARLDRDRYALTPVHGWQREQILRHRYADLIDDGALVLLDEALQARPTAALRTLLLGGGPSAPAGYVKLSLDIQVTSTRRSISVASARNAVPMSRLVSRLLGESADGERVLLMAETAGSAAVIAGGRERDLSAIVRDGLNGRLRPGEVPVPGGALCAVSPLTGEAVLSELVARYGRARGLLDRAAALSFLTDYARLLLVPVFYLASRGVGFEAHLQNCVPTFVDGVPHRLALRDLAGLRVYPGRMDEPADLWPGSVIVTPHLDVMRAKVAYTALQAHLGEVVARLVDSHGLSELAAWMAVRDVVDEVFDELRQASDHAYFTGPTLPHKALLSMRLAALRGDRADIYVRVENPLR
jgi:siderophore synthetase component